MQESLFQAAYFELDFGAGMTMEPVSIPGAAIDAQIRGFVDRVDVWNDEDRSYFKVVDYKTGRKDFDYCDVFNGIGLQMLLYLYALEDEGQQLLGEHPVPTGVQYFPARVPFVTADGALSDDEGAKAREKNFRRKGLLLDDERVLLAMDQSENIVRLPVKRNKDGCISGDIANSEQFKILKKYVFHILRKLVAQIASGDIEPNPYTRGSSHNACSFCPYGAICHEETVENRRNYQAMNADRFWEEIEKELNRHG
jgi:ATP-dependent helicase/nuclease subunit B